MTKIINRFKNIDLTGFLHHEEKIGGLAISEDGVCLTYLWRDKDGKEQTIFQKEISLPVGAIDAGILKNPEALLAGLKELTKDKLPSKSVIVSLPSLAVQPFIFEFFPHLKQEEINSAVSLIINSSLPLSPEKIYADWEEIKNENIKKKKVLLGMGLKELIEPYLEIIKKADFAPVALETHGWSLGRLFDKNEPLMALNFESNGVIFSVFFDSSLVFQFDLPKIEADKLEKVAIFTERIIHFLISDNEYGFKIKNFMLMGSGKIQNEFKDILQKRFISKFNDKITVSGSELPKTRIFSAGAAKRGLLPRYQDTVCSLMPIGTELAYERQRLISFFDFFQKFAVGFGLFFIILFLGVFILVNIVEQNAAKNFTKYQAEIPPEIATIKAAAVSFNQKISQLAQIEKKSPKWENLFLELDKIINSGLIIGNLTVAAGQPIEISGTAKSRENLLQLRTILEQSPTFTPIVLPLSLLIGKENISFSFKLELKDPLIIYKNEQ